MKCKSLWMCILLCSLSKATSLWAGRSSLDVDVLITTLYDSVHMDWHLTFAVLASIMNPVAQLGTAAAAQTIAAIN